MHLLLIEENWIPEYVDSIKNLKQILYDYLDPLELRYLKTENNHSHILECERDMKNQYSKASHEWTFHYNELLQISRDIKKKYLEVQRETHKLTLVYLTGLIECEEL